MHGTGDEPFVAVIEEPISMAIEIFVCISWDFYVEGIGVKPDTVFNIVIFKVGKTVLDLIVCLENNDSIYPLNMRHVRCEWVDLGSV